MPPSCIHIRSQARHEARVIVPFSPPNTLSQVATQNWRKYPLQTMALQRRCATHLDPEPLKKIIHSGEAPNAAIEAEAHARTCKLDNSKGRESSLLGELSNELVG